MNKSVQVADPILAILADKRRTPQKNLDLDYLFASVLGLSFHLRSSVNVLPIRQCEEILVLNVSRQAAHRHKINCRPLRLS